MKIQGEATRTGFSPFRSSNKEDDQGAFLGEGATACVQPSVTNNIIYEPIRLPPQGPMECVNRLVAGSSLTCFSCVTTCIHQGGDKLVLG